MLKRAQRLGEDTLAFAQRERRKGLVFQALDGAPLVVIAYPAFERGKAAAAPDRRAPRAAGA